MQPGAYIKGEHRSTSEKPKVPPILIPPLRRGLANRFLTNDWSLVQYTRLGTFLIDRYDQYGPQIVDKDIVCLSPAVYVYL